MKDYALELAARQTDSRDKLNSLREYVQAYLLKLMHEQGAFRSMVFVGGTALRFLYDLPRFSEDLDFSSSGSAQSTFLELMKKLKREMELAGYVVDVKAREQKTVQSALFCFARLLHDAGLSPLADQKFAVKIEVDSNPPEGSRTETKVVNKYFPVTFLSYDIPSLFSGKLHAVLTRTYTKGRDLFDLGWYLSRWKGISPNIPMLVNALKKTGWQETMPDAGNWRELVAKAVGKMDWAKVVDDVEVFLQSPGDMTVFSQQNILALLKNKE